MAKVAGATPPSVSSKESKSLRQHGDDSASIWQKLKEKAGLPVIFSISSLKVATIAVLGKLIVATTSPVSADTTVMEIFGASRPGEDDGDARRLWLGELRFCSCRPLLPITWLMALRRGLLGEASEGELRGGDAPTEGRTGRRGRPKGAGAHKR